MVLAQQQLSLNVTQAVRLLESRGCAMCTKIVMLAPIRRSTARAMQMPKTSSSTDEHVVKVIQDNIPALWLRRWVTSLGWTVTSSSKETLDMATNKPKGVGKFAGLHLLSGKKLVYMGLKLYKPAKEPTARAMFVTCSAGDSGAQDKSRPALSSSGDQLQLGNSDRGVNALRAKVGRIWSRVREEEVKRMRAEEASRELQEQVEGLKQQLSARSQKVERERHELSNLRFRCKAYAEKVEGYQ
eukprot:1158081-Pleurochrysis_carterae.AAC.1